MDDGLIQILVIAFIIIISMMDGAARKKRKEAQRRGEVGRGEGIADAAGERPSMKTERTSEGRMSEGRMSEGMVPDELWEEIAALARGGPSPASRSLPPARVPGGERAPYGADRSPSGFQRTAPTPVPESEELEVAV